MTARANELRAMVAEVAAPEPDTMAEAFAKAKAINRLADAAESIALEAATLHDKLAAMTAENERLRMELAEARAVRGGSSGGGTGC